MILLSPCLGGELPLGTAALIFCDCFSSRGGPDPLPQPLRELLQAHGAHPHQPAVERPEPAVGLMVHVLGASRAGLQEVAGAVQARPELLGAAGGAAPGGLVL
jgi:hypothetical protein